MSEQQLIETGKPQNHRFGKIRSFFLLVSGIILTRVELMQLIEKQKLSPT